MIWLEVRYQPQTLSTQDGVRYAVRIEALTAGGIDKNVFVYRVVDDVYMYPAMVHDMTEFPIGRAAALAAGTEFYRTSSAERQFTTSASTAETIRLHKSRLSLLVRQWQAVHTTPIGDETVEVYTSE